MNPTPLDEKFAAFGWNVISIDAHNYDEIKEAIEAGKQAILLMNRRGFSTYTQCKACGTVVECPDCSIPMVWHADGKTLS